MTYELGMIGAGNMAEAIARGVIHGGLMQPAQIIASDVSAERRQLFIKDLRVEAVADNVRVARDSQIVLLCVKPQYMQAALANVGAAMNPQSLIISIAAGISSA